MPIEDEVDVRLTVDELITIDAALKLARHGDLTEANVVSIRDKIEDAINRWVPA